MLAQMVVIQLALKETITSVPGPQPSLESCAFHKHASRMQVSSVMTFPCSSHQGRGTSRQASLLGWRAGPGEGKRLKQGAMASAPRHAMSKLGTFKGQEPNVPHPSVPKACTVKMDRGWRLPKPVQPALQGDGAVF